MAVIRRESTLSTIASPARADRPVWSVRTSLSHSPYRVFLQIVPTPVQDPFISAAKTYSLIRQ